MDQRRKLIDEVDRGISIRRQCDLLGVNRSGLYYKPVSEAFEDLEVKNLVDEIYTETPFYGSRRIAFIVGERIGQRINRKRISRLMREMGIAAIGPSPNLSKPNHQHSIFPYLLRGRVLTRPNEVWSTDITYVRLRYGFAYLIAVIDWFSRFVISWRLSNTMDTRFCVDTLKDALISGKPEIFNTDQGSQFTSNDFVSVLKYNEIKISMDGRGRALDNVFVERLWRTVKYEDIYPKGYDSVNDAQQGLESYFDFYNMRRPHQSLRYLRPWEVHHTTRIDSSSGILLK